MTTYIVAKQHPDRPEVSMFATESKADADQYAAIGWTVMVLHQLQPLQHPQSCNICGGKGYLDNGLGSVRKKCNCAMQSDDADHNAPWLTEAHMLCTDLEIPPGHITERLQALRKLLTRWINQLKDAKTLASVPSGIPRVLDVRKKTAEIPRTDKPNEH